MDLMHIEKTKQKEKCFPRLTAGSCQEMPITIEFLKKKKKYFMRNFVNENRADESRGFRSLLTLSSRVLGTDSDE
jgi:hypothetical protein